ncbi:MAG: peptidoglycan DD-metalloendopeptidase family protein [Flavobacteriales bacterium]
MWLEVSCTGDEDEHKEAFLKKEGAYFTIGGGKCICEAKVRAFMRMIRKGEGTIDEGGYTRIVGGSSFADHEKDMSTHPKVYIAKYDSTAAGAYQITKTNWNDTPFVNWRNEKGINDFSKVSQDVYATYLIIEKRKALDDIQNDNFKAAVYKCRLEWASLPGAGYEQREEKIGVIEKLYDKFLNEELSRAQGEEAKLYIQQGFLKKYFDYNCCNDKNNIQSKWHHPLDRMELRGWYKSGFYPKSSDHGLASVRISGKHDGLDLYAPIGTTIYACVDGEIYDDYTSGTYGKTLGVKGEYNGTTYYFFYGHLSKRDVKKGDLVKAGDPIGETGQTGNASGQAAKMNHLHFEVRTSSFTGGGNRIDPLTTIEELRNDVNTNPDKNIQTGNL